MKITSRQLALDVIGKVVNQGAYSNIALDNALSSSDLSPEDSGLATEITYGTLKYLNTIDVILSGHSKMPLNKLESNVLNILRMSLYQLRYLDRIPDYAVINEAVNMTKEVSPKASGFVNGILRSYLRDNGEVKFRSKLEKLAFEYSFPLWMVKMLSASYKSRVEEILIGLNARPVVTYRVNTDRISRDEAVKLLEKEGFNAVPTKISPYGIEVRGGSAVLGNRLFTEGFLTVQDESSMLCAPLLEPKEGKRYFDLCSAPGGKATHIAELAHDRANVIAFDIYDNKIKKIEENKERLGLKGISTRRQDATVFVKSYEGKGSVLLDAPCSGLGIIRKKPEIKYTKSENELREITELQRKLLETAKRYVEEEGYLVYSTCTLNPEENENNVRWFLEHNPDFVPERIDLGDFENLLYTEDGFVTVLPNETMDGFFLARLKKRS